MLIHKENFLIDGRIVVYEDLSFHIEGVGTQGEKRGKIVRNMPIPRWVEGIIAKGPQHAVLPLRVDKVDGRFIFRGKEVILSVREEASKPFSELYVKGTDPKDENAYKYLLWGKYPEEERFKEALQKGVVEITTQIFHKIYSYEGKDLFDYERKSYTVKDIETPAYIEQFVNLKKTTNTQMQELSPIWEPGTPGRKATKEGIFEYVWLKKKIPYIQHLIQWNAENQSYYVEEKTGKMETSSSKEERVLLWKAVDSAPHTEEIYVPATTEAHTLGGDGYRRGLRISDYVPAHYETVGGDLITYENGETVFIPENEEYVIC